MYLAQHKKKTKTPNPPTTSSDAPLPHRSYATVFNQPGAENLVFHITVSNLQSQEVCCSGEAYPKYISFTANKLDVDMLWKYIETTWVFFCPFKLS